MKSYKDSDVREFYLKNVYLYIPKNYEHLFTKEELKGRTKW